VRGRFGSRNTRKATKVAKCFRGLCLFLRFALLQHLALDFFDEEGQVGAGETQVGGGDAIVLNVGRNVFMVGIRAGQRWIIC